MRTADIRRLCILGIAWAVWAVLPGTLSAEEKIWTYRHLDPLFIEIPESWASYSERNARGFYTGKPPSGGGSAGSLFVLAGRERKERYEDVLAPLKRSPGGVLEMSFEEAEGMIGGRDAVVFTNTVSRKGRDAGVRPFVKTRGIVWKKASGEGILLLVTGGDAALFDEHAEDLDRIIASVRFDEPHRDLPESERTADDGQMIGEARDLPLIELPSLETGRIDEAPGGGEAARERPVFASDDLLDEEIRKIRTALSLRDEGAVLLARGDRDEALERFRRSLDHVPDGELSAYIDAMERLKAEGARDDGNLADALRREGVELQRQGHWREALEKYRESLSLKDNEDLREIVSALENLVIERATALVGQGDAYESAGRLENALDAYAESLSWSDDEFVRRRMAAVERLIRERSEAASRERLLARGLWSEGEMVEEQGRLYEALGKYRESLKTYGEEELRVRADTLEAELKERTRALVGEGIALQRDAKFPEALGKFRESLKYYPYREVEVHLGKLEEFLKK
jgi:tetratricopeptide (TPR) repeat protein